MRFTTSVAAAIFGFASSVLAQTADFDPVYTPKDSEVIPAGSTYEITWDAPEKYQSGTVALHLIGGATQNTQVPLMDIASGIPNSAESYSWTVDASLGAEAVYGIVVTLESDTSIFQYSMPFHIDGEGSGTYPSSVSGESSTSAYEVKTDAPAPVSTPVPETTDTPEPIETPVVSSYDTPTPVDQETVIETATGQSTFTVVTSTSVVQPTAEGASPSEPSSSDVPENSANTPAAPLAFIFGLGLALLAL